MREIGIKWEPLKEHAKVDGKRYFERGIAIHVAGGGIPRRLKNTAARVYPCGRRRACDGVGEDSAAPAQFKRDIIAPQRSNGSYLHRPRRANADTLSTPKANAGCPPVSQCRWQRKFN
jgi:hypothetical protein